MHTVEVIDLYHDYNTRSGESPAVDHVSFEVAEGEFFALLGPSGCGKTTTLRCVAGLERPKSGEIRLNGETVVSGRRYLPTHRRDIGMVFQDYAIWPHMTVFENVAFPLRVAGRAGRGRLTERVEKTLAMVGLDHLAGRRATQLSGGQQQRVSLARALVREPAVLLLDEPLSNLDAALREQMRAELRQIQQRLGVTTLFVTHDQDEALSMASRIALMKDGVVVEIGTPRQLYQSPRSQAAATFVGPITCYPGTVTAKESEDGADVLVVRTALGLLRCRSSTEARPGEEVTVAVRPENVVVHAKPPATSQNVCAGKVRTALFRGGSVDLHIEAGGQLLRATRPALEWSPDADDGVHVELPPATCMVLTG